MSIVIPVLDEAAGIGAALRAVQHLRARSCAEVIVVDGGSRDETVRIAAPLCDLVVLSPRGRAHQMNAGAQQAKADILLFLHADTLLPGNPDQLIAEALARPGVDWGRFDIRIDGPHWMLPVIGAMMNARSRLTGVATGDQAMFVRKQRFFEIGGFADIPLMEDIWLSKKLRAFSRPACLRAKAVTSGRRWEKHGIWRTIWLMWKLRAAWFCGADPADLAARYGYGRRDD